jgi:putative CocE/NonD family hydrolase
MLLGLPDESSVHGRPDVPTFTSEPLTEPLDLLGAVSADLTIDADGESTHAIVRLLDVDPSGAARYMLEGSALVDCSGGPTRIRIPMANTAYRVRPGHRLRLAISTSMFPLYLVHPGTEKSPFVTAEHQRRAQRLIFDRGLGPALSLTVRRGWSR